MDRLVDTDLTASASAAEAQDRDVPACARTAVIGAGIAGTSAAHHLATQGDPDVEVLDCGGRLVEAEAADRPFCDPPTSRFRE